MSISRLSQLCVLLWIVTPCIGNSEPFGFWGSIAINGAYKSNLFLQPAKMDTGNGEYNPVEADADFSGVTFLYLTYKGKSINRLKFSLQAKGDLFPRHLDVSEGKIKVGGEYTCKPGKKFHFALLGDGGYVRRQSFTESDGGGFGIYQHSHVGVKPGLLFKPTTRMEITTNYRFLWQDYHHEKDEQSLDNYQHMAAFEIVPRFGSQEEHTLTCKGSYIVKKYRNRLSYDANGEQLSNYPLRKYYYVILALSTELQFGPVSLQLSDQFRDRIDAFENYFGYYENKVTGGLVLQLDKGPKTQLQGSWKYRYYPVYKAKQPGPNPNLRMNYYSCGIDVKQKLWKQLFLLAEYNLDLRRTNTGYLSYTTYRDYTCHFIVGGLRFEW